MNAITVRRLLAVATFVLAAGVLALAASTTYDLDDEWSLPQPDRSPSALAFEPLFRSTLLATPLPAASAAQAAVDSSADGVRGDFNGDGEPDLLLRHESDGRLYLWYMTGRTHYPRPRGYIDSGEPMVGAPADLDWRIGGTADFNHDGHTDLLWHHQTSGRVYVWYMRRAVAVGGVALGTAGANWNIVGTPDLQRDGNADVLWHNAATGSLYVWYVSDGRVIGGARLPSTPATEPGWTVVGTFEAATALISWQNKFTGRQYEWFMQDTSLYYGREVFTREYLSHAPGTFFRNPLGYPIARPEWRLVGFAGGEVWLNSQTGELYYIGCCGSWEHLRGQVFARLWDPGWKVVIP